MEINKVLVTVLQESLLKQLLIMALLNLVNLKEKRLNKYYYRFGEPCKRMQGVNV